MKWVKENAGHIITAICSVVATYFVTIMAIERTNQPRYLSYYSIESSNLLNTIKQLGDSVTFAINSKNVDNLNLLEIVVSNNSNMDFEDVPIILELYNQDGKEVRIISMTYLDHNGTSESISYNKLPNTRLGGIRYQFNVAIVNRYDLDQSPLRIKILMEGESLPQHIVYTNKKGLGIKVSKIIDSAEIENKKQEFIRNTLIFVMSLSLILLMIIYRSGQRRKRINTLLLQHLEEMELMLKNQGELIRKLQEKEDDGTAVR